MPLKTHYDLWRIRKGIIVSLQDEFGENSLGEIAPLPWFGTETLDQAIALCGSFSGQINLGQIHEIADCFPACQFGFETAIDHQQLSVNNYQLKNKDFCQLLPQDSDISEKIKCLLSAGFQTFKLKIAVTELQTEIDFCKGMINALPMDAKLRLDANGGLTLEQAKKWLEWGDRQRKLEFIEQPLAPEYFDQLLWLEQNYQTSIALDESVTNVRQLQDCYEKGWRGIFVIKAAIAGFPSRLKSFCQNHELDLVFSTVFETEVGRQAVLKLAMEFGNPQRALGMGGAHWFQET